MQQTDLEHLYAWFREYTSRFTSDNSRTRTNLDLKTGHTLRVANNCRAIAESLHLTKEQCVLAEVLGLFHDVGRFPQFMQYGTFRDGISRSHAEMSVEALDADDVWRDFTDDERQLLTTAILNHNQFTIPADCTGDTLLFSQLIRDADKLDNLEMRAEGSSQRYTITLNAQGTGDEVQFQEMETVSPKVREAILQHRCVLFADVQTAADLALIIIGTIFDLNFSYSFRQLHETDCVERIFSWLPQNDSFREMREAAEGFIEERIAAQV